MRSCAGYTALRAKRMTAGGGRYENLGGEYVVIWCKDVFKICMGRGFKNIFNLVSIIYTPLVEVELADQPKSVEDVRPPCFPPIPPVPPSL